jgi:hypothetical protein
MDREEGGRTKEVGEGHRFGTLKIDVGAWLRGWAHDWNSSAWSMTQ